jgi:hypothetical protein
MSAAVATNPARAMQQSAGKATISLDHITPSCAKAWMRDLNTRNFRPYSRKTAEKYADDMVDGKFGVRPETAPESNIVICTDPESGEMFLGNGQHRLGGCIIAAERSPSFQGFWCGVMRGADPLAMLRMDVGKKRKISDYLAYLKVANPTIVAPALRILYTYKNKPDQLATQVTGTADQLLELLGDRPDIHRAVRFAINHSIGAKPIPMTTSWLAVARMLIGEVPDADEDRDFFWTGLATRDTPNELANSQHPIVQMRRILDSRGTRVLRQHRLPAAIMFGHVLKAWNLYRDDSRVNLIFKPGGKGGDLWPIPR